MPVEQVFRAIAIDDLAISVSAWRWICDVCGRRETFPDVPMPEGASEFDPGNRGWRLNWRTDGEACICPTCAVRGKAPAPAPEGTE